MPRFEIPPGPKRILQALSEAGCEAYLVGGCVRDLLRGEQPHDWDICTSARPEQTASCFRHLRLIETGRKHGTVTVLAGGEPYEITTYRTEGPYSDCRRPDYVRFTSDLDADLARRDFTMNAIAMDASGGLRDPFGGEADVRRGLIRCVGDPACRFREDGLRILRALRFAAVLGYGVHPDTAAALHACRDTLDQVAAERIREELCRMLAGASAGETLRQYPDVLCRFWPELEPLIRLEQRNPWHCWNGWEHTLHALEASPPDRILRLAVLLHDIGKPSCKSTDSRGVDHFYHHAAAGAELADRMLRSLKFDGDTRKQVAALVKLHDLRFPVQDRTIRRWLGRLGEEFFFRLLEVQRADAMGQSPELAAERLARIGQIRSEAERILAGGQCLTVKGLAVSGHDILAAGAVPGPEVGRVLNALLERVLSGSVPNERAALLALAGQILNSYRSTR